MMPVSRPVLISHLDHLLNAAAFADYGPNGLQVEGRAEIHHLATAATASLSTCQAAVAAGADALLVHHGILWGGCQPITGMLRGRIACLLSAECNLLGYHLPLDAHPELGNNAWALQQLGAVDHDDFATYKGQAIGRRGRLGAGANVATLADQLHNLFNHEVIHCPGGPDTIEHIAVVTGGGQGYLAEAAAAGCQALITGETSEQTWHEAAELGIHCFACGHHATESRAIHHLGAILAEHFALTHSMIAEDNPL
ncbi:MAG: Nif3-like dinuclear metal center hexameric protein [Planctomycetota bacterium]|jgi:dinuclear metal center YbgI/SA1388 family protein